MRINVLSVSNTKYIVNVFCLIIDELKDIGYHVDHYSIDSVNWYGDDISKIFIQKQIKTSKLPRPSNIRSTWWYTKNAKKEAITALPEIERYLNDIVRIFSPDILLIADDQGVIEKYIIKYANSKGIVVFLLEHGPGFTYQSDRNKTVWFYSYQKALNFCKLIVKKLLNHSSVCYESSYLTCLEQNINQFGKNGNNVICAYSGETSRIMAKSGIDDRKIYNTGFPYWDIIFNFNKKKIEILDEKKKRRRKIMLISTGRSKNNSQLSISYYGFCFDFYKKYAAVYDIFLRLKPGEIDFLEGVIPLCDNSEESYFQINNFDLIIGEFSTVLLEAIIIGKPIVLYSVNKILLKKYKRSAELRLKEYISPLTVNGDMSLTDKILADAFEVNYISLLQKKLHKYSSEIFNGIDGNSSSRVCDVIESTISNKRTIRNDTLI